MRYDGTMMQLHMTEAEVSGNFPDVLAKVRDGVEVVVEHDHQPVAVIRSANPSGRPISECIASASASGSRVTLDGGFAADVEEGIRSRQAEWNPPSWD
jgi:antitoxin (DNA-binding transcriptional repressor) of toxin-antitoxin stability system